MNQPTGSPEFNPWSREASPGSGLAESGATSSPQWSHDSSTQNPAESERSGESGPPAPAPTWDQPAQSWDQPAQSWDQPAQAWNQPAPAQSWEPPAAGWDAAGYGQQMPSEQMPTQQMPTQQNGYPVSPYQQPVGPYGQLNPYAFAPVAVAGPPMDKPHSRGGLTGLLLAGGALVLSVTLSIIGGLAGGEVDAYGNPTHSAAMTMGMTMLMQLVCTGLGIAGLVVSATNLKYPSQKPMAIPGLVIAIAAPVLSFIVFVVAFSSVMAT